MRQPLLRGLRRAWRRAARAHGPPPASVHAAGELRRAPSAIWLGCGPLSRLGLWSPGEKEFGDRGGHHVHFAFSVSSDELRNPVERLRELDHDFRGPVEHEGGDHSLYLEDPEGNVVELWDFFEDGDSAEDGIDAL